MKAIAVYLLAVLGGNTSPSAGDIKNILGSVGAEADDDKIELLLSELKGQDITEVIANGREKLASVPSGGGAAVAVAAAAPAAAESKKEEKVEEKEESDEIGKLVNFEREQRSDKNSFSKSAWNFQDLA